MDANNLSLVICPTLLRGSNVLQDVAMCGIPNGPTLGGTTPAAQSINTEKKTTLGVVIKLCIQHYYEIFDEIRDRSEAIAPQRTPQEAGVTSSSDTSSAEGSIQLSDKRHSFDDDDDDEIDDAMLVMPIGPSSPTKKSTPVSPVPPSAWGATTYKQRQKPTKAAARSMHDVAGGGSSGGGPGFQSVNKARSTISIDRGPGPIGTMGRKGSISVGRGTMKKSSGAGVEAIGITAEGFFSPPSSAPPVPPRPRPQS